MTFYLIKKERVPVPEDLRSRVRNLAGTLGRGKAIKALHISTDLFMDLIDANAIAIPSTLDSVRSRLDAVEKQHTGGQ